MVCEIPTAGFDIAAAAGWYSAVAGLLAGFAMLAILLPLDHETRERGADVEQAGANGVVVFTSAFFALLVLTFTYAVLAGQPPGAIAAHEQQLNGAAFGVASLLMLLGLREVLRLYGGNRGMLEPANALIGQVTGVLGPIVLVAFGFSNALEVEFHRHGAHPSAAACLGSLPGGVWLNGGICAAAMVLIALIPLLTRGRSVGTAAAATVGRVTLLFTVFVAVWTAAVVPFLPAAVIASAFVEHLIVTLNAIGSVAFAAAAWLSRHSATAMRR